jgi:AcrR family transcriptional regulator
MAALAVFSQKGYERATIADIAHQAGIAKGVVYDYFPSKEDLFTDLFHYVFPRDTALLEKLLSRASDAIGEVETIAAAVMQHYECLGTYFNVVAQFWARGQAEGASERFAKCWQEVYSFCRQGMASSIRRGVDSGLFRSDLDVPKSAWALVATVDGSILQWLHSGAQFSLQEHGLAAVRLLLRGLVVRPELLDERRPFSFCDLGMTDQSVMSVYPLESRL